MNILKGDNSGPPIVTQFYHSHAFPFLISKWRQEIRRRLKDVPEELRRSELAPTLEPLGETSGDAAWQVFRHYLDLIERRIADIVRGHSPSYWFHLHRRLRPMLAQFHEGKTDDMTVRLVRRIAELAYAKHGNLDRTDDLGPITRTRLQTFLDGAWYEAVAQALGSKLQAQKQYQTLKRVGQVVMVDFHVTDLCDVFGIEGLCYEYWWASAAMRAIGKGAIVKWDSASASPLRYKDTGINPLCLDFYDQRNSETQGFLTRLGTWIDELEQRESDDLGEQIYFAQLRPNPSNKEYPTWDQQRKTIGRGFGATNFEIGKFSLATFRKENKFMAALFKQKHGVELDAVLFAIWAVSFFGIYTGFSSQLRTPKFRLDRTMSNLVNVQFRGYTMANLTLDQLAHEAVWWAEFFKHERRFSTNEARQGIEFISLSKSAQGNIGLWSGGKRPVLVPSMHALMIDLAAIMPFLHTLFFGLKKVSPFGGEAFEESVRVALRSRGLDICLRGILRWQDGSEREVDAAVRLGDRLVLIECFSYELPLDYEVGKPSVFEMRKQFILDKLTQARTLCDRMTKEPKGTNFDVSWATTIEYRVASPFVEFAWHFSEPLFDEAGFPRVMQARELIEYLSKGTVPAQSYVSIIKKLRDFPFKGVWF